MVAAFKVVARPATEPVTLAELKDHLRVAVADDDNYLSGLLVAATDQIELLTRRAFIARTMTLKLDAWPEVIELPRPPLIAVSSVAYIDTAGASQIMPASDYDVDTTSTPGRLAPAFGVAWPAARDQLGAITVTYEAGYDDGGSPQDAARVPALAKHAIKHLAGHWYDQRAAVVVGTIPAEMPFAIAVMVASLKVPYL